MVDEQLSNDRVLYWFYTGTKADQHRLANETIRIGLGVAEEGGVNVGRINKSLSLSQSTAFYAWSLRDCRSRMVKGKPFIGGRNLTHDYPDVMKTNDGRNLMSLNGASAPGGI